MSSLLETRDVTVRYRQDGPAAVAGASARIDAGEALGIVGESGSGKSTFAKVLAGVLAPSGGEVQVKGRRWQEVKRRDPIRRTVQMIFQDPYGALNPWMSARETVAEVFRFWERQSRAQAVEQAEALLAEMGLSKGAMARRPGELSGGQCQRVGIARALACSPDVLIADEPTSALDVSVQAQILNILVGLRETRGLAIVLISHDLAVVRYVSENALVMYAGQVVERGPTADLLGSPWHPYTKILMDAIPGGTGDLKPVRNEIGDGHPCCFAARCPRLQADCQSLSEEAGPREGDRVAHCMHPLPERSEQIEQRAQ
ncbi:MAG: ABC transporter ATP-binding protein [Actinobacteria bacterium]|nr:ABC transporter ATP-binding protein [Actinomycetota bacterium]